MKLSIIQWGATVSVPSASQICSRTVTSNPSTIHKTSILQPAPHGKSLSQQDLKLAKMCLFDFAEPMILSSMANSQYALNYLAIINNYLNPNTNQIMSLFMMSKHRETLDVLDVYMCYCPKLNLILNNETYQQVCFVTFSSLLRCMELNYVLCTCIVFTSCQAYS